MCYPRQREKGLAAAWGRLWSLLSLGTVETHSGITAAPSGSASRHHNTLGRCRARVICLGYAKGCIINCETTSEQYMYTTLCCSFTGTQDGGVAEVSFVVSVQDEGGGQEEREGYCCGRAAPRVDKQQSVVTSLRRRRRM